MSDPIKAALREAGEAARKAMAKPGCCIEGTGCELPPCHCSQVAAAAAVAAFLRALPTMHFRITPGHVAILGQRGLEELAAAVTRAAQEDKR
jgi:hypothetical protein